MTIKGPNAHDYSGGLGDLLGWEQSNRYDYSGDYDVEAHRRYLHDQQQKQEEKQHQQQYQPEYNDNSGFANALTSTPSRQRLSFAANQQAQSNQQQSEAAAEQAALRKEWWEKKKKQAINILAFLIIVAIYLGSGQVDFE